MGKLGFKNGRYNASTYYHPTRKLRTIVHGDDFATVADVTNVAWLRQKLEERFELKTMVVGSKENRVTIILNRVIRCTDNCREYEADQRHAEFLVSALNLQNANPVSTPQEEVKPWLAEEGKNKLDSEKASEYRSLSARANYLAAKRMDIQCAVEEICRAMLDPIVED